MTQALAPLGSLGPLLVALILVSLGVGLPIIIVLAIRLLWDRQLSLGRSRELDKLVWQLHRVASALETVNAASLPAQQSATAQIAAQRPQAAPAAQTPSAPAPVAQTPVAATPSASAPVSPAPGTPTPAPEQPQKAGVNSMFGF